MTVKSLIVAREDIVSFADSYCCCIEWCFHCSMQLVGQTQFLRGTIWSLSHPVIDNIQNLIVTCDNLLLSFPGSQQSHGVWAPLESGDNHQHNLYIPLGYVWTWIFCYCFGDQQCCCCMVQPCQRCLLWWWHKNLWLMHLLRWRL